MKILKTQVKNNIRKITVELQPDEKLVAVKSGGYYKLSRLEDVVQSDVLTDARRVYWCDIAQGWVES